MQRVISGHYRLNYARLPKRNSVLLQLLAEATSMYQSEITIRARYGETDQMGYVYYGNYASYYEVARVESLRKLGLSYRELEGMGVMMPVLENHSKFLAPAVYDEELRVVTTIRTKPGVRIKFEYEIFNEHGKLIHTGETLLAFVQKSNGRPCKPPAAFELVLKPYFN
jgi:acyl-CoA thioester hydrolase